MKAITTVILLFVFLVNNCKAQNKIEGIGEFKIRKMLISDFDAYLSQFKRDTMASFDDYRALKDRYDIVARVLPDTIKVFLSPSYSHLCKSVKVFYVPFVEISGIELNNTYLTFYKDTLISLHTDLKSEIVDAFQVKYGKGKVTSNETIEKCTLEFSNASTSRTSKMYYQTWTNRDISCNAAIGDYIDRHCKKQSLSYIDIDIQNITDKIRKCNTQVEANLTKKEEDKKRKDLSDF